MLQSKLEMSYFKHEKPLVKLPKHSIKLKKPLVNPPKHPKG